MKKNKSLWSLVILLALIAVTYYFLFRNHELSKLMVTISQINPLFLVIGLLLMFLFVASEGFGIELLLKSFSYKTSFLKCLKYSFIGFYYCSIFPAGGGQPVQIYYMNKDRIEVGDASLCIVLITLCYPLGMLLTCLFSLIVRYRFVMQNLGVVKYSSLIGAVLSFLLVLVYITATLHTDFIKKIIAFFIRALSRIKIIKAPEKVMDKISVQLEVYKKGALYLKARPKILLMTLITIIVQILSRLSVAYAVYRAFGLQAYGFLDILSLQAVLAIGVEYMPIPGSVGVAEAGFYTVNSMIFGKATLMSAILLTRGISYYAYLIISGSVSIFAHLSLSKRRD